MLTILIKLDKILISSFSDFFFAKLKIKAIVFIF